MKIISLIIFTVHCVWKYMNCSTDDDQIEGECRDQFSSCSDNVDEEDEEGAQGLPDVPGVDLPSLIESGNGKILTHDTQTISMGIFQNMRLVFWFSTTALTQSLHARKSSTTVQISCLSKFPRRKLQIHKEAVVEKTLQTATLPILLLEVVNNQKVRIGKEVVVPRNLGIGTHRIFLMEVGKSQKVRTLIVCLSF